MLWIQSGGPEALKALGDLGLDPAEEDLPPKLHWEVDIWVLYESLFWQRLPNLNGWSPIDYIALQQELKHKNLDRVVGMELINAIYEQEQAGMKNIHVE